jgi:hypothetical protein
MISFTIHKEFNYDFYIVNQRACFLFIKKRVV